MATTPKDTTEKTIETITSETTTTPPPPPTTITITTTTTESTTTTTSVNPTRTFGNTTTSGAPCGLQGGPCVGLINAILLTSMVLYGK